MRAHVGPCLCWAHANLCVLIANQTEIAKRAGFVVQPGGSNGIYYVKDVRTPEATEYEVNLAKPECCAYVSMHKQPCRHMVPVLYSQGLMDSARATQASLRRFWPKWALAARYRDMYEGKSIRKPKLYTGPYVGPEADRLASPKLTKKKRGRPKRKRYRWKPQTVKTVQEMLPVVYNVEYNAVLEFM